MLEKEYSYVPRKKVLQTFLQHQNLRIAMYRGQADMHMSCPGQGWEASLSLVYVTMVLAVTLPMKNFCGIIKPLTLITLVFCTSSSAVLCTDR